MPTFGPPHRNVTAYGDCGDVACAQLHSSMRLNNHVHAEDSCVLIIAYLQCNHNQNCEFAVYTLEFILKLLYVLYGYHHLSFFLPRSVLFSLSDPVSAVLQHCEVMMRNRVIMPVVKPQATQQMCFRDPAFVSE